MDNKNLKDLFKKVDDPELKRALTGDETTLPPPGDKRDEALKMRKDILDETAEKTAENQGAYKANPKAFEPVREAQYNMTKANDISNKNPEYEYLWVWMGQQGFMIRSLEVQGWEVVQGDDPAGKEFKTETSIRRFVDTILMKIKKTQLEKIKERNRMLTERMDEGVTGEMQRLNEKYKKYGVSAKTNIAEIEAIHNRGNKVSIPAEAIRQIAVGEIEKMLKEGRIPGWEIPNQ